MAEESKSLSAQFASALEIHGARYGVQLSDAEHTQLDRYYEIVMAWNKRLHLVAPCSPAEFATRHVLESLLAVSHLPHGAEVCDVGSGAGLPLIPCLIVRPDVRATLIESSAKKAVFLREALLRLERQRVATVIAERFENTVSPQADFITCRALDRFTEKFAQLFEWSPPLSTLLLFGSNNLREQIGKTSLAFTTIHIPDSTQRFLFVVRRAASNP